jgi:hypothetical protein
MARRRCKYGKLKNPRGRRVCKRRPATRRKRWSESSRYKRDLQREYDRRENAAMGRHRRKRR